MRILSLFDGMSCGMIAFKVAGIPIDSYDAYEIDKFAVQVATHNFPETKEHGDVFDADFTKYEGVDYVIGGSPCTYWSIAQSPDKRETTASGIGWELFSQYVRAIKEAKPKYFIYENNKSMAKAIYDSISATFGFEPIMINSALVSAQNRERYYWVGKRNSEGKYDKVRIEQPKGRGILLKDILITGDNLTNGQKAYALTASYDGACAENTIERSQRTMVAEPFGMCERIPEYGKNNKSRPVIASYSNKGMGEGSLKNDVFPDNPNKQVSDYIAEPINATLNNKAQTIRATCYKDGLRNLCGNDTEKKTAVAIKVMNYELESVNNTDSGVQAMLDMLGSHIQNRRVLNRNEKSSTITAGGGENHEPKVFMQVKENTKQGYCEIAQGECVDLEHENSKTRRGRKMQDKANALKTSNEFYQLMGNVKLHKVENEQIEIKGKKYPIKLKDGYYVIRKLTVRECARLQTIPEWYDFNISNSQAYKCIGNGWTIEVIMHLIRATQEGKIEPKQLTFWEV